MNKYLLCTLLAVLFVFSSCSKDDDPLPKGQNSDFITFVNNSDAAVAVVVVDSPRESFPSAAEFLRGDVAPQVVNAHQRKMLQDQVGRLIVQSGGVVTLFVCNQQLLYERGADHVASSPKNYSRISIVEPPVQWTVTYPSAQ